MTQSISIACLLIAVFFLTHITAAAMTADIEYARVGDTKLLLDAHVPDGDGPFPVAIFVHGGGWGSGDKHADTDAPAFTALAKANLVVFSINYRLAPANKWPACFDDVKAAVRWAKAHAAGYKGDPGRIALVGYSAGGQLALLAALTADEATRVQAVAALAPPTDFELDLAQRGGVSKGLRDLLGRDTPDVTDDALRQLRDIGPVHHIHAGQPPVLILHGTADKSVPFPGTLAFQKAYTAAGNTCEVVPLNNAPHRLTEWSKFSPDFGQTLAKWVNQQLKSPTTQKGT
ncbi:MAG: alpha/beta hydrolase [Tepidisphaeraceae bacterium]